MLSHWRIGTPADWCAVNEDTHPTACGLNITGLTVICYVPERVTCLSCQTELVAQLLRDELALDDLQARWAIRG